MCCVIVVVCYVEIVIVKIIDQVGLLVAVDAVDTAVETLL